MKDHGISRRAEISVKSTLPLFVRVIVYSNTSPIIPSQPLRSTTEISSFKIGRRTVIVSGSVSR